MRTTAPAGIEKHRPRIGLTMYGKDSLGNYRLPADYASAVVRAGGLPVLLPPVGEEFAVSWLAVLDGVVLCGGGDIHPQHYGAGAHASLYGIDADRDATELALARIVLACRLPTLAICRGMQLINVLLGGSLHQHLPDLGSTDPPHRGDGGTAVVHAVQLAAESSLDKLLDGSRVDVMSLHHQAIDRLGRGLQAIAWGDDGVIEAVALRGNDDLIAVQWHPEMSASRDRRQQRLFDWLVACASRD